jgi:hypothetical protein
MKAITPNHSARDDSILDSLRHNIFSAAGSSSPSNSSTSGRFPLSPAGNDNDGGFPNVNEINRQQLLAILDEALAVIDEVEYLFDDADSDAVPGFIIQ